MAVHIIAPLNLLLILPHFRPVTGKIDKKTLFIFNYDHADSAIS